MSKWSHWDLAAETRYQALRCLEEYEAKHNTDMSPEEWGICAYLKGIYHPRIEGGTQVQKQTRYMAWGTKAGRFLFQLGLVKRRVTTVTYKVYTRSYLRRYAHSYLRRGYSITAQGRKWMREYERNEKEQSV